MDDRKRQIMGIGVLISIVWLTILIGIVCMIKQKKYTVDESELLSFMVIKEFETITKEEVENLIDKELYILNDKKNINEITNLDKFLLSLLWLENKDSFTKEELEEAFNKTCISLLEINHENISDNYIYDNGIYTNILDLENTLPYNVIKKVVSFNEEDGKYTISLKYLWFIPDKPSVYAKYQDLGLEDKSISFVEPGNVEIWFNDNYESIKDNLDTYNYVFVKENGKINLIDFYVN